jgi:hypothetical protein
MTKNYLKLKFPPTLNPKIMKPPSRYPIHQRVSKNIEIAPKYPYTF